MNAEAQTPPRAAAHSLALASLLALSMLTRLPAHPTAAITPRELRWSVMFYPWVGLLLGGALFALAPALSALAVPNLGGLLLVALLALLTGGLHLDGLADWFDAVGGGRGDRQRMLDIMKDSRIGAHGAVALVLVLLAKCTAFDAAIDQLPPALCIAPVVSRFAIVPLVVGMKPAREQGLAHAVHGASALPILIGAFAPVAALIAVGMSRSTCVALVAACVMSALIGAWAQRRLGGATGDVYGAALELSELAAMVAMVALHARA